MKIYWRFFLFDGDWPNISEMRVLIREARRHPNAKLLPARADGGRYLVLVEGNPSDEEITKELDRLEGVESES